MKQIVAALGLVLGTTSAQADPVPSDWEAVLQAAQGQTVYWNAWGGSTTTNTQVQTSTSSLQTSSSSL